MDAFFEEVHQMMEQIGDKIVHIERTKSMFDNIYRDYNDLKDLYTLMVEKGPTAPTASAIENYTAIDCFHRASLTFKLETTLLKIAVKQLAKINHFGYEEYK